MSLDSYFPPAEVVLNLKPEELAIPLLNCLIGREEPGTDLNLGNFVRDEEFDRFGGEKAEDIRKLVTESWAWLERELMIAPNFKLSPGWVYVTKKGKEIASLSDIHKYINRNMLLVEYLDQILASKVFPLFIRGDHDIAVFQAFKEVEIRVRAKAQLSEQDYGVPLMRKAFDADDGPLTDMSRVKTERQATAHLFSGSIGLFKNPSSHRDINWEDPIECAQLIYFANQLLRIVERHSEASDKHNNP